MELIGHELIKYTVFKEVTSVKNVINFDNLLFKFSEILIKSALDTDKTFSVYVESPKEAVLANALGAKYIVIDRSNSSLIKDVVKLAEYYLFDSKVATVVENFSDDLVAAINLRLDVAIHRRAISDVYGF